MIGQCGKRDDPARTSPIQGRINMTIMRRINAAPLTPELMKRLVNLIDEMQADQRDDLTRRGVEIIRFLEEHCPGQDMLERASVITAFEFPMQALESLRTMPEYRAWTLQLSPHKEEPRLAQAALIEDAAEEPLIERLRRPTFDPVSFFKRVLAMSEAGGRA
jgi:hypothetical protein